MAGRRLVLDRQHLIQMLGDPEFFTSCPQFLWLRRSALAAKEMYDESARRRCCGGDWNIMRPVVDAFFNNLRELQEVSEEHVQPVKVYLQNKKNSAIGTVVIHYRATKEQPRPERFTF